MGSDPQKDLEVHMNRLRGYFMGFIEALGLPEKQERGIKSTVKAISYECQKDLSEWIDSQSRHSA